MLDVDGAAIPGLYAAGNVIASAMACDVNAGGLAETVAQLEGGSGSIATMIADVRDEDAIAEFAARAAGIAPGPIDTPMPRSSGGDWPPPIINDVPLHRIGHVDDIAYAALWLASDQANYISGATLTIDGGRLAP